MQLRRYRSTDAEATRLVFERAIRSTAAHDYSPAQVDAWASSAHDAARWAARRGRAETIVAVADDAVVGFGDLLDRTLLDMLYVDPAVARRGIGSALIDEIVRLATAGGASELVTNASITARPTFERSGFVVVSEQRPVVRGVAMTNHRMRRDLRAA